MLQNGKYFESVLGKSQSSFIEIFKKTWNQYIQKFPGNYSFGEQFIAGERFRPVILCWGYLLSGSELSIEIKRELSKLALYIELLHKATLLIDDLIDKDIARHGKKAFHVQYSNDEAILFSIYLIGDSLEKLIIAFKNKDLHDEFFDIVDLYCNTIKEMAYGALQEINLKTKHHSSLKWIKEIIERQTISLINNGFITGFKYGKGPCNLEEVVEKIGYDFSYIFQLLNDLEPFGSADLNASHKGKTNIDILNSRKNIIVTFIHYSLKKNEKIAFNKLIEVSQQNDQIINKKLFDYFKDKNVIDVVATNLRDVRLNITRNISLLSSTYYDTERVSEFAFFLNYLFQKAISRVGPDYNSKLSEILIM